MITDRLRPTLQHLPGEIPSSLASRLAQLHIGEGATARLFCADMGIEFNALAHGLPHAITTLGTLAGVELDRLNAEAFQRVHGGYLHRGELFPTGSLIRTALRFCSACLLEDVRDATRPELAAYSRSIWSLSCLRTCPIHCMEIIEFNPERNPSKTHDFAWQVKPHLSNLERIADQALRRAPSPLEVYALDRLGGTVGNAPWLDALPLHVGLAICDYMGMVQRFGREVSPSELTGRERMEAGGCGFSIAKSGEAGIREFMDELIRTYPYSRSATEGPQAVLGRWFKFIAFEARDASFEGVRAFVHNVLVERMPFGPGDTLLGKPVTRRVLHSVTSASQEMKVHPKRLRKILHAADVLTTDQLHLPNGNALFDAQAATETLLDAVDGLFMTEVETYLGAGRVRTKLLVDAGIVQPMFAKRPDLDHLFRRRDLDSFLDRLCLDAIPIEELAEDMADIQTAAKQACCGSMEIVRLILDRKLPWVGRLATVHGFAAIHVRLSEVRSAVQGSMEGWLTAKAIEHKLNTNTKVVRNLIDFGYLKSQKIKSPLNRCPVTVVSDGDFGCFDEKYISLFEIMRTTKIHFLQVKKRFKSINVVPSIRREEVGAAFYRRSDISYIWN